MDAPALYDAILDAGDQLEAALRAGDLDRADEVLAERDRLIGQASRVADPPSRESVERYRSQERRLRDVLAADLAAVRHSLDETNRMAAARGRYAEPGKPPAQLDTAPR